MYRVDPKRVITVYLDSREMRSKIEAFKGDYSFSKYTVRALRAALEEDERKMMLKGVKGVVTNHPAAGLHPRKVRIPNEG